MPCDTQYLENETPAQRKAGILESVVTLSRKLASGEAKAIVGPQGAIAFTDLTASERNRVTDACLYRRIMVTGSAMARAIIRRECSLSSFGLLCPEAKFEALESALKVTNIELQGCNYILAVRLIDFEMDAGEIAAPDAQARGVDFMVDQGTAAPFADLAATVPALDMAEG